MDKIGGYLEVGCNEDGEVVINHPMSDRIYYRVEESSPVMAVIQDAEARQKMFYESCEVLKTEFSAASIWTRNNAMVCGLEFTGALPKGWRRSRRGYAVPDKRNVEGRRIAKRLEEAPRGVDALAFSSLLSERLNAEYAYLAEHRLSWTVFEKHGDAYVLSVPLSCNVVPPQCSELRMSEYWRLRETQA